jgi:chitin disaccharide deacetylase
VGRLIVNADDFGLTSGVNRAILELHRSGVLTSTTLMARAKASDEAIEMAKATPSLAVGCHIVLADGEPILPASKIPTLVEPRTGCFPAAIGTFVARLLARRIKPAEIEAETCAQIEYLRAKGVVMTHIDTHKHTHMFPSVLRPVLRAARSCGITAVRNPFEPRWAIRAANGAAWLRLAEVSALRWLEPICRRIIVEEGFATTDGTVAVAGTGALDRAMMCTLLAQLPDGTWELVTHPGYNDADLDCIRTRLRASRDVERAALQTIQQFAAIELVSFADLNRPAPVIQTNL